MNVETLQEFVRKGQSAQQAIDDLLMNKPTRYEEATRERTRTLLEQNPHMLPEVVARHYTMLAIVALQLKECLYARKAGAEGMEDAIAHYLSVLRLNYIKDFGVEPNWLDGETSVSARRTEGGHSELDGWPSSN